jgi:hypothetical protein
MARFSDAAKIATQFGSSDNEEQAFENSAEAVVVNWVNQGVIEMQKTLQRNSTSRRNKLAQSFEIVPQVSNDGVNVKVTTTETYYDFVDKGVKKSPVLFGGKSNPTKNKAPRSPYSFKNVYTSKAMVNSFKQWASFAGAASKDARRIAYLTKRGGIKPKNYIQAAIGKVRVKELSEALTQTLGRVIIEKIKIRE